MKALFIKDLRLLMRQQRATLFLFIAVILLVITAGENPMFGIMYTVFLLPALLISSVSYDTFENGMPWLMALPVSRKDYVVEKYLLAAGGSVLVNLLASGLAYSSQAVKGGGADISEYLICALSAQIVILVYSAFALPVNICFGTEKGRIVMIIMAVSVGAVLGGTGKLFETQNEQVMGVLAAVYQLGMVELLLLLLLFCAAFMVVSCLAAVKWMEKKEY